MTIVFERFDGAAAWAGLSADQRDVIGPLALELLCAQHAVDIEVDRSPVEQSPHGRAAAAAEHAAYATLLAYQLEELPELFDAVDGHPRISSIVGPICRECGCTEQDACPEGCGWAEADLCTACVRTVP